MILFVFGRTMQDMLPWLGVTKQICSVRMLFPDSPKAKRWLSIEYYINIWQVSLQWLNEPNFYKLKASPNEESNERGSNNSHQIPYLLFNLLFKSSDLLDGRVKGWLLTFRYTIRYLTVCPYWYPRFYNDTHGFYILTFLTTYSVPFYELIITSTRDIKTEYPRNCPSCSISLIP